jgi:Peptidase family M23/FG-GAP-like repeat
VRLRLFVLLLFTVWPWGLFAQTFVYPVGDPNQAPTGVYPNPNGYRISQYFQDDDSGHTGVDLSNGVAGGEVRSIGPGVVTLRRATSDSYGFGNVLIIRHDLSDGTFYSLYAHLQDGSVTVEEGDSVTAGEPIAAVDCTGSCQGAHLHFAVKRVDTLGCGYIRPGTCTSGDTFDNYVEPLSFIADHRATQLAFVRSDFMTGSGPASVATGDFNGDGRLDLATANYSDSTVSVLLGTGDGTFLPKVDYQAAIDPWSVTVADLNGDGFADLAIATDSKVSILLGLGDGTFASEMDFPTDGRGGDAIVTGDFNHDGSTDLAVADAFTSNVSILLGNGDGTFASPTLLNASLSVGSIVVRDFNGDGNLDLAFDDPSGQDVSILFGDGTGAFPSGSDFSTSPYSPISLAVADVNTDGKLDLLANLGGILGVLLGNGDGTFGSVQSYGMGSGGSGSDHNVVVGDFDSDGKLDVALVSSVVPNPVLSVLLGAGDGTFNNQTNFDAPGAPGSTTTGDFNGDGKLDLAVVSQTSNLVYIFLNTSY